MPKEPTLKILAGAELTVRWEIPEFTLYKKAQEAVESQSFSSSYECCDKWCLICYPMGNGHKAGECVSIFLRSSCESTASFEISILNINRYPEIKRKIGAHFFNGNDDWGYIEFAKRPDVLNLLCNDTLTISCTISVVQPDEYFPHLCLRGNKKMKVDLANDFEKLLFSPDLSDVEICVKGEGHTPLPAHKCVLAARSPVFEAMFRHNMSENQENKVIITDLELDVVKEMLYYIYTGHTLKVKELAERLFFAADKYQLNSLKLLCEKSMVRSICVENVCRLFLFSVDHNLRLLKASASAFASDKMESVMKTSDFDSIMTTNPVIIKELFYEYIKKHKREQPRSSEGHNNSYSTLHPPLMGRSV